MRCSPYRLRISRSSPTFWLRYFDGISLPMLLLVCHLGSIFLFLLGAWRVATRIFSDRRSCWGAVLLAACCFTLPAAGTSLSIMDPYVTARSFSTPLSLFALAAVLDEKLGGVLPVARFGDAAPSLDGGLYGHHHGHACARAAKNVACTCPDGRVGMAACAESFSSRPILRMPALPITARPSAVPTFSFRVGGGTSIRAW